MRGLLKWLAILMALVGTLAVGAIVFGDRRGVRAATFHVLARCGSSYAAYRLGLHYLYGAPPNAQRAEFWLRAAAEDEHLEAMDTLWSIYAFPKYGLEDHREARMWIEKAASLGHPVAFKTLGLMYFEGGYGVSQDYTKALEWLQKSASGGDFEAMNLLGTMYGNGHGVGKDEAVAVLYYRRAAEGGNATAQFNLGGAYRDGRGVERDFSKAVKWLRAAADQGETGAINDLALLYEEGEGVDRDEKKAFGLFLKAAQAGEATGQFNVGRMLLKEGAEGDSRATAIDWLTKAEAQGVEEATELLQSTGVETSTGAPARKRSP